MIDRTDSSITGSSSIREILNRAADLLSMVSDVPKLEAEILLAFVMKRPRSYLHTWPELKLADCVVTCFEGAIRRRAAGEPVAYLTGTKEFWTMDLTVNSATLIPRPETELLVELILKLDFQEQINHQTNFVPKVADMGTGTGAISLALAKERPDFLIFATDINEQALITAKENAERHGVNNISFCQGSWCSALPETDFDVIVSNPPYIAETEWPLYANGLQYEPYSALVSGKDGMDAIRELTKTAKRYLRDGGYLLMEHGMQQAAVVQNLLSNEGYSEIITHKDLAGHDRATLCRFKNKPHS